MKSFLSAIRFVLLAGLALGLAPSSLQSGSPWGDPPPNWKGGGTGTTVPDASGAHIDSFSGKSTFLGKFNGEGFHFLNPVDFTFVGQATWTAANGEKLYVTYAGQVFFSGDPVYPFGFDSTLTAVGGTGRFAGCQGSARMTGAFTGVPGELYFDFSGTLRLASPWK